MSIKNWSGKLSNNWFLGFWEKTDFGYKRNVFFRREGEALFQIVIYEKKDHYTIGFRQFDGRGILREKTYKDLEEAKLESLKFVREEFFGEGIKVFGGMV